MSYGLLLRLTWAAGPAGIVAIHVALPWALLQPTTPAAIAWGVGLYLLRMLAITAALHRLLAHRSYEAPRWWGRLGALLATTAGQMGPVWWVAHHRRHHRVADQPGDPHSPVRGGFWHAQFAWLFTEQFWPRGTAPRDLKSDRFLAALDWVHWLPFWGLAAASWWLGGAAWLAAWVISSVALFHAVALVNSASHLWGTGGPIGRANWWVALLTLGEGWHDHHHQTPGSPLAGHWLDPTGWLLRGASRLGIIRLPSLGGDE
jgi:stearoyl-CoA desaturase (delta-9 desaturase)